MQRVLKAAVDHPVAATKWESPKQTPPVFQPGLKAQPWWHDLIEFPIAEQFKSFYQKNGKTIRREVDKLLGVALSPEEVEVDDEGKPVGDPIVMFPIQGLARVGGGNVNDVMYQASATKTRATNATIYSTVTLFDGLQWTEPVCKTMPTICKFLKDQVSAFCTKKKPQNVQEVVQQCATNHVVTLTKLRPGTTVREHTGPSNQRLIMYACLQGCDEVETSIGGQTITSFGIGDGGAKVGDDSFSLGTVHRGDKDLVLLNVLLPHPNI